MGVHPLCPFPSARHLRSPRRSGVGRFRLAGPSVAVGHAPARSPAGPGLAVHGRPGQALPSGTHLLP
eukprot:6176095-Prorocentrum_lima.AAC.1